MGVSVTEHAAGGEYLGTNSYDDGTTQHLIYYYRVAKGDGGYDYYKIDGSDVRTISGDDALTELGKNEETGVNNGYGTSGSGSSAPSPFSYKGVTYNPSDPASMQNFYSVRNADYYNQLNQANSEIDYQANQDIAANTRTYGDRLNEFNKNLDLYNTGKDDYTKQLADLYEGFGQGNVARQNYFTRLAPDTYQSGQGSSADYANKKYQQGYTETNDARNEWKGNLDLGKTRLGEDYNNWMTNYQRSVANQKSQNIDQFNSNKDSLRTDMLSLGNKVNVGAFTPVANVEARNVDLSQYTPYTNFQGLQTSPGANLFKKFQPTTGQDPLSQTLGYTLPTKASDPINSYLYSK